MRQAVFSLDLHLQCGDTTKLVRFLKDREDAECQSIENKSKKDLAYSCCGRSWAPIKFLVPLLRISADISILIKHLNEAIETR